MSALFKDIFGAILSENDNAVFGNTVLVKHSLDLEQRKFMLNIESSEYITREKINSLRQNLENVLRLNSCEIEVTYPNAQLTKEAIEDIVNEIRLKTHPYFSAKTQ